MSIQRFFLIADASDLKPTVGQLICAARDVNDRNIDLRHLCSGSFIRRYRQSI